jgi:hypothetical protein
LHDVFINHHTMKDTKDDIYKEFNAINDIAERIVNEDMPYIKMLMKEVVRCQPFYASTMADITKDLDIEESDDIMSLFLIVWGAFRKYPACMETAVGEEQFERVQQKNISMFRYLEKEEDTGLFDDIVYNDINRLDNGPLMSFISHCFRAWPALTRMDFNDYTIALVVLKSFIECIEEVAAKKV